MANWRTVDESILPIATIVYEYLRNAPTFFITRWCQKGHGHMKHHQERILSLLLVVCLFFVLPSYSFADKTPADYSGVDVFTNGDWKLSCILGDGKVTIVLYSGDSKKLVLPKQLDGYPVVAIGYLAFSECNPESLSIPDSVTMNSKS